MNKSRRARSWFDRNMKIVFLSPAIIVIAAIVIYPMLYSFYLSLHKVYLTRPNSEFVGLKNYLQLIIDPDFLYVIFNTIRYAFVVVVVELVLGFFIALFLYRRRSSRASPLLSLFMVPMAITPIVVGMVWMLMYQPTTGVINYAIALLGVPRITWLADPRSVQIALYLVDIWQWTPFIVLVTMAGLQSLPDEPMEAAYADGASFWQITWHVNLPQLLPVLGIAILIRSIDALRIFENVYMLTGGGPGNYTEVLSLFIYQTGLKTFNMGVASAASYITAIIISLIITFLLNLIQKTAGGKS